MSLKRNLAKRAPIFRQKSAQASRRAYDPARSSSTSSTTSQGQERVHYPDREAKQIRNHPYLTQLDFFETVDEQGKAWEEQRREREINKLAGENGTSDGLEKAK